MSWTRLSRLRSALRFFRAARAAPSPSRAFIKSPHHGSRADQTSASIGMNRSPLMFGLISAAVVLIGCGEHKIAAPVRTVPGWTEVLTDPVIVNAFAVNGEILFAGTESGILRTSDNGATWKQANNGLPD